MYELLLLGQIPGTEVRITFEQWQQLVVGLLGVWLLLKADRHWRRRQASRSV